MILQVLTLYTGLISKMPICCEKQNLVHHIKNPDTGTILHSKTLIQNRFLPSVNICLLLETTAIKYFTLCQ